MPRLRWDWVSRTAWWGRASSFGLREAGFIRVSSLLVGAAMALGILALVFSSIGRGGPRAEAVIGTSAPNQMSLDGVAPGAPETRTITGSANFTVGINVVQSAGAYNGYQWEIEFPTTGLAFVSAT